VNGNNPVAVIFARDVNGDLTSLVKQIDKATAENKSKKMGSFVVFLTDDKDLEEKLKELAEKEGIKKTVLTMDNIAGPTRYKIEKDADVTVVFYNARTVKANHAFKKGELNAENVKKVMADLPKLFE
jgi:HrpA-like RNA helicase